MNKKLLWGVIIATWLLTWCSKNNTVNEEYWIEKSDITILEDSINQALFNTFNKKSKNYKSINHKKIQLEETRNTVNPESIKDSTKKNIDNIIRMYEARIDDWDEMKDYIDNHNNTMNDIGHFIILDIEWEDEHEVKEYDSEEDNMYIKKIK